MRGDPMTTRTDAFVLEISPSAEAQDPMTNADEPQSPATPRSENATGSGRSANVALGITVTVPAKEISPEASGKLFEPFYTTREKGTGLGLAFARDIAADHGGAIELASADGETTFSIVIPA